MSTVRPDLATGLSVVALEQLCTACGRLQAVAHVSFTARADTLFDQLDSTGVGKATMTPCAISTEE